MAKKIASLFLSLAMIPMLVPAAKAAGTSIAYASPQNVEVDGKAVQFQMYALKDANGYDTNYVNLRDVAYVLDDSPASFDVDYDEATKTIEIWKEVSYLGKNGTEMTTPFSGNRSYMARPTTLQIDYWQLTTLDAIVLTDDNGGGYTYFKLRDLGETLGFQVDWSAERGIITIETGARTLPQTAVQVPEKADEVVRLVNEERAKAGLSLLSTYPALTEAAQIRAAELTGYYSHTRPDGTRSDTVLAETGADKMVIDSGENIANGTMAQNPSGAMMVWMNSPGHRAAILNPSFTHIGVGCVYLPKDPYRFYWVQVFTHVDGTSEEHVQPDPAALYPDREYYTDPLFRLNLTDITQNGGMITLLMDEAWTRAHGTYTAVWSMDSANVISLETAEGSEGKIFKTLTPGEVKVTCKITGEDGYTAEAYCYITVSR